MVGTIRHQRKIREIRKTRNLRKKDYSQNIIRAVANARSKFIAFDEEQK